MNFVNSVTGHILCDLTFSIMFLRPTCLSQNSIPFYGRIILLCMENQILFIYLLVDEHFDCFHLLAIMNNIARNICIEVFVWAYVSISIKYMSRNGISGSCNISIFIT